MLLLAQCHVLPCFCTHTPLVLQIDELHGPAPAQADLAV